MTCYLCRRRPALDGCQGCEPCRRAWHIHVDLPRNFVEAWWALIGSRMRLIAAPLGGANVTHDWLRYLEERYPGLPERVALKRLAIDEGYGTCTECKRIARVNDRHRCSDGLLRMLVSQGEITPMVAA